MASQLPLQELPLAMGKVHFLSAICRNELPGLRPCHEAAAAEQQQQQGRQTTVKRIWTCPRPKTKAKSTCKLNALP